MEGRAMAKRKPDPRLLTVEQVHAALPQPSNYPKVGFKGTTYVQMTWHDFNEWAENIQRAVLEKAVAGVPGAAKTCDGTSNGELK
jgi:hypothetical protein